MDQNEINAQIRLLDDPDNEIFNIIRQNIMNQGPSVIPFLEKAWENSFSEMIHSRIESIIQSIQFRNTSDELYQWVHNRSSDLLYGAFLISKYQYPDQQYEDINKKIEVIKNDVWIELNDNLTALEKIKIINHILFDIHKFTGNYTSSNSPQNCFISHLLENKKGNPVTLSILYAAIAQRLSIPIFGVNLINNFILAYQDESSALEAFGPDEDTSVLFYINAYNKGAVFGRREIDFFLKQQKIDPDPDFYNTCSNIQTIRQLIGVLIGSYERLGGYEDKIRDLKELYNITDITL